MSAIVIQDLSKKFRRNRVLTDLNLEVQEGEFFSLLGLEDAGKTTLARILFNFLKPSSGSARIFDMDIVKESKLIKELVSYVPEDIWMYENMKPRAIFNKTLKFHDSINTDTIDKLVDYFEINDKKKFIDLTEEDKKLVGIINGLITKPKLVILDEPTKYLSPDMSKKLLLHLKMLQSTERITVLLLTRDLSIGQHYADRVAYLSDGQILDIEYIKEKDTFDKLLHIYDDNFDLKAFTDLGLIVVHQDDFETQLFYDGYLPNLTTVLYQERIQNYTLEDAVLKDKIRSYTEGDKSMNNVNKESTANHDRKINKEETFEETQDTIVVNPVKNTIDKSTIDEEVKPKVTKVDSVDESKIKEGFVATEDRSEDTVIEGPIEMSEEPEIPDETVIVEKKTVEPPPKGKRLSDLDGTVDDSAVIDSVEELEDDKALHSEEINKIDPIDKNAMNFMDEDEVNLNDEGKKKLTIDEQVKPKVTKVDPVDESKIKEGFVATENRSDDTVINGPIEMSEEPEIPDETVIVEKKTVEPPPKGKRLSDLDGTVDDSAVIDSVKELEDDEALHSEEINKIDPIDKNAMNFMDTNDPNSVDNKIDESTIDEEVKPKVTKVDSVNEARIKEGFVATENRSDDTVINGPVETAEESKTPDETVVIKKKTVEPPPKGKRLSDLDGTVDDSEMIDSVEDLECEDIVDSEDTEDDINESEEV